MDWQEKENFKKKLWNGSFLYEEICEDWTITSKRVSHGIDCPLARF